MGGLISKSTITQVNSVIDAIAVVGDYVRLEKKSGRWWGKCPFHGGGNEKTASFKVDPDLKMYHCFGCGKGGTVVDFIMEMDKLTFPEAVKNLAHRYNIEIVYEGGSQEEYDSTIKDELYELYRRTTITFQHFLHERKEGENAKNYLSSRGIDDQMIERFKLGFSPYDRDFLYNFLSKKNYSQEFLEKSGLFSARYKTLPLFSGRLMFPISDRQSKVVAFGGRAMPGVRQSDGNEPPKYINSPETEIYKKSQTLYALDVALAEIRQTKTAILAEGYMDVIALHQAGVVNAVAPLGTAFTEEQALLLRRWAEKIVLVFDTDEAGEKAAYKSIMTCRKSALSCALVQMEAGLKAAGLPEQEISQFKDPADILQKFGGQILKKVIECTINDFEYLVSRSRSMFEAANGGKYRAAEYLFPYLEALNSEIERDDCIARIADAFKVDYNSVQKDFLKRKAGNYRHDEVKQADALQDSQIRMNVELFLLTVVSVNMELYKDLRTALEIKEIDDPSAKELFIALEECFIHGESGLESLLARIKDEPLKAFIAGRGASAEFTGGSEGIFAGDPRRLMEDGINEIRKRRLLKRLEETAVLIRTLEKSAVENQDNQKEIDELLAEKKFLDSQLRKLEQLKKSS